jgi:hypothetical protein
MSGKRRVDDSTEDQASGVADAREVKKRRPVGDDEVGRRLACPYFKRDPRKYSEERSCVGPGWRTVHRVK